MQIVFCGTGWLSIVDRIRERLPPGVAIRVRDCDRPIVDEVRDADVIIPSNARIDADVIGAATRLKLIQQPAAGYEGVDLAAARARGIPVCNAPGKNAASVAETALFLMLALARRLPVAERALRDGVVGEPVGRELSGKTVGIVGFGASGSRLGAACEGLDMRVVSVDSKSSGDDLAALLAEADVVSLHCPLTDRTRGLIDGDALARMKPGALLINCTRGPVVDRAAVEEALERGHLGGLGLDVHWVEPPDLTDPLYRRDDVVALPHVAGSTNESFGRLAEIVAHNVAAARDGGELLHRVA